MSMCTGIEQIIALVPDIRLSVAEHASNGEFTFVHWIMHATGAAGLFRLSGIDRIRLRDGRVAENIIRFDSAELYRLLGRRLAVAWHPVGAGR